MGDPGDNLWWDSVAWLLGIPKGAEWPSNVLFERVFQSVDLKTRSLSVPAKWCNKRTSETDKDPSEDSVNCSRTFRRISMICCSRVRLASELVVIWFFRPIPIIRAVSWEISKSGGWRWRILNSPALACRIYSAHLKILRSPPARVWLRARSSRDRVPRGVESTTISPLIGLSLPARVELKYTSNFRGSTPPTRNFHLIPARITPLNSMVSVD